MKSGQKRTLVRGKAGWIGLCVFVLVSWAWANVPTQVQDPSAAPGTDLVQKSKEAREAALVRQAEALAAQAASQRAVAGEPVGPLEDIPSTATLFLLDPVRPEKIEAVDVGEGLKLTGRVRIGDAEVYILEPVEPLPFELPVLSLSEALQNGLVEVREIAGDEAQALRDQYPSAGGGMVVARNKGDVYVLFVGGEVLDGGNQDRMVASSTILAPKSGWVPIPVNCVEQGRSQGPSPEFRVAAPLAHPVLRAHSLCRADQQAVWGEIARVNHVQKTTNETQTYLEALDRGRDRAAIGKAAEGIGGVLSGYPNAVGLVFVRGGAVQSVERMASPALFKAQSRSILASHLMGLATRTPVGVKDAAAGKAPGKAGEAVTASAEELKSFFELLRSAERARAPLNHQGVGVVVHGQALLGGETLTNVAPRDPSLRKFAADLARKGPAPNVLNQWAVRLN